VKEIYGIFYFENYDENTLYTYTTKELAERELQVLKAKNDYIGYKGKIEKFLYMKTRQSLLKFQKYLLFMLMLK